MDGEQKFIVVTVSLALICLAVFGGVLLAVLWQYRVWIALSIAVAIGFVLFIAILLGVLHSLNEQALRHKRVRYHEELPTNEYGVPYYMPVNTQVYPQQTPSYYQPDAAYQASSYQTQSREY
jgi:hypothetical protein